MWSTFTLLSEIILSVCVLYVFYYGYKNGKFLTSIALPSVLYETFVNIVYMVHESGEKNAEIVEGVVKHTPFYIGLAIFHGVFLFIAWQAYKKGNNFFRNHPWLTGSFIALWLISVASGVVFYYVIYFTNL